MAMNKIGLVTSDSSKDLWITVGVITADTTINCSAGVVNTEGSITRPLRCSELQERLKSLDWGVTSRRILAKEEGPSDINYTLGSTPLKVMTNHASNSENTINLGVAPGIELYTVDSIVEGDISEFYETYGNIANKDDMTEIFIYNSSKSSIDFLTSTVTKSLIVGMGDTYTNTISLVPIYSSCPVPGVSGKVDLGVQYVKAGEQVIRNWSTCFEAFKYSGINTLSLTVPELIMDIEVGIYVEYVDGIVKVWSDYATVSECIINNCIVTYGQL